MGRTFSIILDNDHELTIFKQTVSDFDAKYAGASGYHNHKIYVEIITDPMTAGMIDAEFTRRLATCAREVGVA